MLPSIRGDIYMLGESKKRTANEIAKLLAKEGMIFGQELDRYIKAEEDYGFIRFKDEKQKEDFIDYMLSSVERIWRQTVVIYDTESNITKYFINAEDAAKYLDTTSQKIFFSRWRKTRIKGRYLIDSYNPKIEDYYEGLDNMRIRWNI